MRLLIVDDHAIFRDSLTLLLESYGFEVVGTAADGNEAIELAARLQPELVLMDLTMPGVSGLEATRTLTTEHPDVRVVVLTASEDDQDLYAAIEAGALGYVRKNVPLETFVGLLHRALDGEPALTPDLARRMLQAFSRRGGEVSDPDALTPRELEVLERMVDGVTTNRALAEGLGVSENTVKFHVRNILEKLHVHNRAQAVGQALRRKLVEPE